MGMSCADGGQAEIGKADLKHDCVSARDTAPLVNHPLPISRDPLTQPGRFRPTFPGRQADYTSPRDALLAERSILTEATSCGLCHRAKVGPHRGLGLLRKAVGHEMVSPVPPALDISTGSQRHSLCFRKKSGFPLHCGRLSCIMGARCRKDKSPIGRISK